MRLIVTSVLITLGLVVSAAAQSWPVCERGEPRAACVVDGDTIRYRGSIYRFATIDAPETFEPRCPAEREAGIRARERLRSLLDDTARVISTHREDRFGRTLATVETNSGNVEEILLMEGLALVYQPGVENRAERIRYWCGRRADVE